MSAVIARDDGVAYLPGSGEISLLKLQSANTCVAIFGREFMVIQADRKSAEIDWSVVEYAATELQSRPPGEWLGPIEAMALALWLTRSQQPTAATAVTESRGTSSAQA